MLVALWSVMYNRDLAFIASTLNVYASYNPGDTHSLYALQYTPLGMVRAITHHRIGGGVITRTYDAGMVGYALVCVASRA